MMLLQNTNSNASSRAVENVKTIYDVTRQSIDRLIDSIFDRLPYIVAGIIVLLLFWLLAQLVKKGFWSASGRTRLDGRLRILFSRLIFVVVIVLGIFTALTVVIPSFGFGDLITGLGFTSFVIGFATKDILNNLLSGVLILWQQPFRIGDYLFVGNNQGKVEYIGVRATQLRKDDGELILIPNGDMYSSAITIRGAGAERRMILKISIGYDSDIGQAKDIITGVLNGTDGVVGEPKPSAVVTDLSSDGVNISIYFWLNTNTHKPMQVFDSVATAIKKSLDDAGIEMYPPSSVIVQTPEKDEIPSGNTETKKRKEDF
ncbi:MAG: mechanosensitive ion channel family protein [Acidobacteria bacterium]|nr:mechanosensitive ion channel family protein [Acidobacteriota bacterium]